MEGGHRHWEFADDTFLFIGGVLIVPHQKHPFLQIELVCYFM